MRVILPPSSGCSLMSAHTIAQARLLYSFPVQFPYKLPLAGQEGRHDHLPGGTHTLG